MADTGAKVSEPKGKGAYDPRCCRFPKSCSCTIYEPQEHGASRVQVRSWCGLGDVECAYWPRTCDVHLLLEVVNGAGVVLEDPRLDYLEVQVDRNAWEALPRG